MQVDFSYINFLIKCMGMNKPSHGLSVPTGLFSKYNCECVTALKGQLNSKLFCLSQILQAYNFNTTTRGASSALLIFQCSCCAAKMNPCDNIFAHIIHSTEYDFEFNVESPYWFVYICASAVTLNYMGKINGCKTKTEWDPWAYFVGSAAHPSEGLSYEARIITPLNVYGM